MNFIINFCVGASTIFNENLKLGQILQEGRPSEPEFSQDHEYIITFPLRCQMREIKIFILAPPPFLIKI